MLTPGKRYWFRNHTYVYSGLYGGETDENNGNKILHRKNGDEWSVPENMIFETIEEASKGVYKKYLVIVDKK